MTSRTFRRRLQKLQRELGEITKKSRLELKGLSGERHQEASAAWSSEYFPIQEEIAEWQSDYVRARAEQLDVSVPECVAGEFWERLTHTGDRLVLTTKGRELVREKIRKEEKYIREVWGYFLGFVVAIGGLVVAALAIIFR